MTPQCSHEMPELLKGVAELPFQMSPQLAKAMSFTAMQGRHCVALTAEPVTKPLGKEVRVISKNSHSVTRLAPDKSAPGTDAGLPVTGDPVSLRKEEK